MLEGQLEEQQLQLTQAFEMRCTLQKLYHHLEEKEADIQNLQSRLESSLSVIPPPPVEKSEESEKSEVQIKLMEGGVQVFVEGDYTPQEDSDSETTEEMQEDTAATLLENLAIQTLEAELRVEIDELKRQLQQVNVIISISFVSSFLLFSPFLSPLS